MRDYEKYHYITIGIPRHSEELATLLEEARHYDVSLPRFLSMLLTDRHLALQGKGRSVWFPRGVYAATAQPPGEEPITDTLKMRAVAAASAWDE